ncbi:hypothetical protein GJ699_22585 [Duganella sp. FT80W]|uniref:TraB/GumN family protein n=1 Tax=Duganella guangzhouensis TaxID=2666084 RepID=A0A6I2L4T0_9BURK|nr:DUF5694 domain-containing protein [Duganella guangzhouensis]MRW92790.1 hypothetical protein [Duganella guangzhouensis]
MVKWAWMVMAALPLVAQAQGELSALDRDMAGPRAQVLVLGTVHLSGMPKSFNPASLDGVLDRLAVFKPDIITVEDLSAEECDQALRQPAKYGSDYCAPTDAAKAATGLDLTAAITELNKILRTWPAQPTPAQRRHLIAVYLAASERGSAYAQWLQLPEPERRAGDSLDDKLVTGLRNAATENNESYQIAARLAARLGLQRVHPVDNHTGDVLDVDDVQAYGRALQAAWTAGGAAMKEVEAQQKKLSEAADLLPLYRQLNDPANLRVRADANVRAAMRAPGYPQIWVAGWEIRNLRMVANIRETFRERPGARVLAIVGTAHKPWFDGWLGQLQGVDIVDAQQVLK